MRNHLAIVMLVLGVAACHTPGPEPIMVGGPCRYENMEVTATVTRIFDDGIEMAEPDGSTFEIRPQDFMEPPEPGQRYRLAKRYIVEGSCTPYSYMLMSRIED